MTNWGFIVRWTMLVMVGCADRLLPPRTMDALDARTGATGVVLNEILADPGVSGDPNCDGVASVTQDEFLELVNTTFTTVDLSGGTVSDTVEVRHTFPAGTVLAPGAALLVFGGGAPALDGTSSSSDPGCAALPSSSVVQTASDGTLGFSNDGDTVVVHGPDGEVLGEHTYGSEGNADQSVVRSPELDGPMVQHTTVSSAPWSPGTDVDGAPFLPDDGTTQTAPGDDDDGGDADGDGHLDTTDCDDGDPLTFPGADERCDGLDNDCDGAPHPDEAVGCAACDAAGMWEPTLDLEGEVLIDVLNDLTSAHDCSDYSGTTDFLFVDLDKVGGLVECVYTGRTTPVGNDKPDNDDMNTEHSWPQSLGAGSNPARCDLHHLYPTDSRTNSSRGNLPFGEVVTDNQVIEGGSRRGLDADGDTVFEPRDSHKGNVARSMLYFAMRYGHTLSDEERALYAVWSASDPVDAVELARTNTIADRQGAPNPYVVCPGLADRL